MHGAISTGELAAFNAATRFGLEEAELPQKQELGILLVDDQADLRKLLSRSLERAGFRVIEASSGERALTCLEQANQPIHLLVTDVVMPGIDGCELARRVQAKRPGIKVLYISGCGGHLVPPGVPFLQKPFSMRALLREIGRLTDPPGKAGSAGTTV